MLLATFRSANASPESDLAAAKKDKQLLSRHNPILVIFPQDTSRKRPGAGVLGFIGKRGVGDYHPISIEAFVNRVIFRERESGLAAWKSVFASVTGIGWKSLSPTRSRKVRRSILRGESNPNYEMDIARGRSQNGRQMWRFLGSELSAKNGPALDKAVVYGRVVRGESETVLQYSYFYLYNDFINNHEGDWEVASIRLDRDEKPVEMGLSSHHGGTREKWDAVKTESDRPIVHVARGSHAMYFNYARKGHPTIDLGKLGIKGQLRRLVLTVSPLKRSRDYVPVDPVSPGNARANQVGVRLSGVKVKLLNPWAGQYEGNWGGAADIKPHFDGIGPKGPWATRHVKWDDPGKWIGSLRPAVGKPSLAQRIGRRLSRLR